MDREREQILPGGRPAKPASRAGFRLQAVRGSHLLRQGRAGSPEIHQGYAARVER